MTQQRHSTTPAKLAITARLTEVRTMRSQLHAVQADTKEQLIQTTDPDMAAALQSILQSRAKQLAELDNEAERLRLVIKGWDKRSHNYPDTVSVPTKSTQEVSSLEIAEKRVEGLNEKINTVRAEMKQRAQSQHSLKKDMTKPHSKETTPALQVLIRKNKVSLKASIELIKTLKSQYDKAHETWFQLSKVNS